MMTRITDGLGGRYPRELINFGNFAKGVQEHHISDENCLIEGTSIKKAFGKMSEIKCDTYLSEFPQLRKHFEKFQGKSKANYTRKELITLMRGLSPKGDDMIRALYETGIMKSDFMVFRKRVRIWRHIRTQNEIPGTLHFIIVIGRETIEKRKNEDLRRSEKP